MGTLYSDDYRYRRNSGKRKSTVKIYDKGLKSNLKKPSLRLEFIIQNKLSIWLKHLTWEALDNDFETYLKNISKDLIKRLKRIHVNLSPLSELCIDNEILCKIICSTFNNKIDYDFPLIENVYSIKINKRGGIIIDMTFSLLEIDVTSGIDPKARSP